MDRLGQDRDSRPFRGLQLGQSVMDPESMAAHEWA